MEPITYNYNDINIIKLVSISSVTQFSIRSLIYPIGVIKTVSQYNYESYPHGTTFSAAKHLAQEHGFFKGLYRGFPVVVCGAIPSSSLYISTLEIVRQHALNILGNESLGISFGIGGAFASLASSLFTVPTDVISQRLIVQNQKEPIYKNGREVFTKILKEDGISGFWRGYITSIGTFVPTSCVWWTMYGYARGFLTRTFNSQSKIIDALSGAIAGYSAGFLCNPLDVVKTNFQTRKEVSILGITKKIMKEAGWRGFFQGASARANSMSITSILMSLIYEQLKRISAK